MLYTRLLNGSGIVAADSPVIASCGGYPLVFLDRVADTNVAQTFGVDSDSDIKTNSNSSVGSLSLSIHQTSPVPQTSFGVRSNNSNQSDIKNPVSSTTDSIEAASFSASPEHQTVLGVYQNSGNQVNTNAAISFPAKSIHQSSTPSLGVYPSDGNQSDSNATNYSLAESIHQAPAVQGGSGLVYSFWKGESMVNHYRYKVKVNGKWKVKSVYIPVGKLPKVREAITNNLGVTAIVTEVVGRQL